MKLGTRATKSTALTNWANRVGMIASSDFHGLGPGHSLPHAGPHLPALREWRRAGPGSGLIWRVSKGPSCPGGLTAVDAVELTREAIESRRD